MWLGICLSASSRLDEAVVNEASRMVGGLIRQASSRYAAGRFFSADCGAGRQNSLLYGVILRLSPHILIGITRNKSASAALPESKKARRISHPFTGG
jgi:hypothetical protein